MPGKILDWNCRRRNDAIAKPNTIMKNATTILPIVIGCLARR